jgi:hypothetical protein
MCRPGELTNAISTLVSMAICEKSNTVENDFVTALANWHELIKYVMER